MKLWELVSILYFNCLLICFDNPSPLWSFFYKFVEKSKILLGNWEIESVSFKDKHNFVLTLVLENVLAK